ncbi:DUF2568 domain-containing protein [Zafaria sp. Z1313]|uniref:DUF2568 domain-containing protein n=1 Tax=Zafaria sp. Z1313 TaxID=3423202 RepID=UPI003D3033E8
MQEQPGADSRRAPAVDAAGALAFILEVALLGAAGLLAIEVLPLPPVVAVLIALAPLIVFWGLYMAPQAKRRIGWPVHPMVAHGLFLLGSGLLFGIGRVWPGAVMLLLTGVSAFLTWRQRGRRAEEARALREAGESRQRRPGGRRAAR